MSRSRCSTLVLGALVPALVLISAGWARAGEPPPAARAANVVQAERQAALAFEAYGRKEYGQAIALYESAFAAAPSADILYNLARVYDLGLHDGAHALTYYRRYLAEPGALSPRRAIAEGRIAELQALEADAPTSREPNQVPRVALLALRDAAVPASAAPASSAWTLQETTAAVLAGSGVLGLGVGLGFGAWAYARADVWRSDCHGNVCQSQRGVDAARAAAQRAQVATIALAAGGSLLAIGATLWWFGTDPDDEQSQIALRLGAPGRDAEVECALSGTF